MCICIFKYACTYAIMQIFVCVYTKCMAIHPYEYTYKPCVILAYGNTHMNTYGISNIYIYVDMSTHAYI